MTPTTASGAGTRRIKLLFFDPDGRQPSVSPWQQETGLDPELHTEQQKYPFIRRLLDWVPDLVIAHAAPAGFDGWEIAGLLQAITPRIPLIVLGYPGEPQLQPVRYAPDEVLYLADAERDLLPWAIESALLLNESSSMLLARMRVMSRIRENLMGLDHIRAFLGDGLAHGGSDPQNLMGQIDRTMTYLESLGRSLRAPADRSA